MEYIGLDLHLRRSVGTMMDSAGRVVKQERFTTNREELGVFLKGVHQARTLPWRRAATACPGWITWSPSGMTYQ
jgi:hypothetical protein